MSTDRDATAVFPRTRRATTEARDWLGRVLTGRVSEPQVRDAVLVLSELVSNVVRHGAGDPVVRVDVGADGTVRVAVTDVGRARPVLQPIDPHRVGGVGLRVVDELCSAWGVTPSPNGKTVWATISPPR